MSHFETAEQRRIRKLEQQIRRLESLDNSRELQREIDRLRRQQKEENANLTEQLRVQEELTRVERAQASEQISALHREVQERERIQQQRIQVMQQQHDRKISQMQSDFKQQNNQLNAKINQTRAEMKQEANRIRVETSQKLRQQKDELQREISQASQKLENRISQVDQKVDSLAQQIAARDQGDKELAQYWAQEAARMLNQLRETFRQQLLDEKRVARLERRISQANNDIQGGQYQSSITAGREAFFDALDMKEELVAAELEWNYWFNGVKLREQQLLEALDSAQNRVYEVESLGETIQYTNGIDYWTFGQLSVLQNQVDQVRQRMRNIDAMHTSELEQLENDLHSLQEQLALIENAAHINVAMSLSRFEVATKIGDILGDEYSMIDSDGEFFGREDRDEYHAIFQNPNTNDQVAVVITPILDDAGIVTNHIELIVGNADNNPLTRQRIADAVAEKLRTSGLEGCAFPCARRFGDDTGQEVARVGNINAVEVGDETARASLPQGVKQENSIASRVKIKN